MSNIIDMLEGRVNGIIIDPLFTPEMIPNFKTMVAAKPRQIRYPYADTNIRVGIFVFVFLVSVLLLIGLGYWYTKKGGK